MNTNTLKKFFSAFMLLSTVVLWAQNKAGISGTIVLSDNSAAESINVALKGTSFSTVSDASGAYEFKNVKPGTYTIRITAVGITTQEDVVTVAAGEKVVKDFTLAESAEQMKEVVIEGQVNKFARKESQVVSKMPLKDIENPQVYNTITAEVLKEQVVTNFDDALKNAPGIDKLWESTGRGSDGAGYFSLRGFAVQPTMINGVPGLTNGSPDPANIERIEVLKGPSSTLFGSSLVSYGGLINITTKRPFETFGGNISYTAGTYGLNRTTLDINTPLGDSQKAFVRLNAAYHTENSFQDAGFRKSLFVAPSLLYKVNDRLTFNINTEFYNGRSTNQTMLFVDRFSPLRATNIAELGYNPYRSYTGNDLYIDTPTFNLQGQMNYKLSDQWTSQTIVSRNSSKSDGYYSYLYEGTSTIEAQTGAVFQDGMIFARYTSKQNSQTIGTDIQQNFIGEFNTGAVKHKFIGGLDYYNTNVIGNNTGYGAQGFVNIGVDPTIFAAIAPALHAAFNIPMSSIADDTGVLTQAGADAGIAALGDPGVNYSKSKQEIFSAYASEVAYLLPNLSVMASLRVDRFSNKGDISTTADDYNQTALSPKFGVVYQPIQDKVAVFANYMNGFKNVAPVLTPSGNIITFDPEQANQLEFGTKLNLLDNKLNATVSYYNIKVSNTVISVSPEEYIQDGEQVNKGIEASLSASPIEGLNILAGYSYNDSRLEKAEAGNDFLGRRPESAGPQNLANLWASYRFNTGVLNGFGLGFGGNYASENKIFNRNLAGTFTLPEYTVLNASVFYNAQDFVITLKLDNITNEEYYKGWSTISPQRPRVFAANFTYNF
ncbi:TonB-dependent receptor [Flavobacterium akiainvivens]|uniref:TonB-dependent receptor n=1 Tax=Flavobacterium akiainvivens TaxID=1202724 RepID=A0A0M8MCM4_9FLAO|nr:TonB-dependent receptor [Flavobacterium akiainvivens]KOS07385.1 TonB-dependent receptor [Flavobacterium akiainvivens]SFQ47491.1 iron complex outermembrane recepter protein [Flavobacterium akiainvivens]